MIAALIGREGELVRVGAFLDGMSAGPRGLVLTGEPGIGKTVLWERGIDQAASCGVQVLSCRCAEQELLLSFSGLVDLFVAVFDNVAPALPRPRRRALEVALLLAEPGGHPADSGAIGLGVVDVLRALAARGPVLVAIDDLQWLDASSARALQMALRRLQREPIGLLATLRDAPEVQPPFDLGRVFSEDGLAHLSVGALSVGALHHLLRDRLGLELVRPELVKLHQLTQGNPFYALELGRELKRTGGRIGSGAQAPVSHGLRELLMRRLSRLAPDVREVALVVSAAGRPAVELVIAACPGPHTVDHLEAAARDGVLLLDGERVRFEHPLLASLCYEQASLRRRRAAHAALAGVVGDTQERLRHRALAVDGRDESVAADLEAVAGFAEERGAIVSAELLELAANLTPPENAAERRRRLMRAAWAATHAGDSERAASTLEDLLGETPAGGERSDVFFQLAWARARPDQAVAAYEHALAEAAGDDHRRARILGDRSTFLLNHGDLRRGLADARTAFATAEQEGDTRLLARTSARLIYVETFALESTPNLLERAEAFEEELTEGHVFTFFDSPRAMLGVRLMFLDQLDRSRQLLEHKLAQLTSDSLRVCALFHLIELECVSDRWQHALQRAQVAQDLAEQVRDELFIGRVLGATAYAEAHLGQAEHARVHAAAALAISQALSDQMTEIGARGVLGHLELALGNARAAADQLRELPSRMIAIGWNDPSRSVWPDTIETLIALGELAQARAYLEQYDERAQRANERARASASRCFGLLDAAEGKLDAALGRFDDALDQLGDLPYPFERARVLLASGSVHRKARHKRLAREALEQVVAAFDELGARLWAAKAAEELRRISGRRAATGELTETEQRVANLAAEGRANKEIAANLFMSVHTVEWHLGHVYRKLGLRSRAELARELSRASREAAKP